MTAARSEARVRSLTVSAPGKVILAGEHSAVYGRPALVAAADARLVVHARDHGSPEGTRGAGSGVSIELPDLDLVERTGGTELREYARRARERWEAFAADPTPERFRSLRGGDAAHLVKVALGETLLAHGAGVEPCWSLRLESALPVGSGMGSSAAAAAALVTAVLDLLGQDRDLAVVEPLVLEAERRQHGSPSGVDSAVVLRGGVQWVERGASGELRFEALPDGLTLLEQLRVVDSGTPAESTGEVVAAVRQRRGADPAAFDRLLDRLASAAARMREALIASDGPGLAAAIWDAQRGLEEAGVVPPAVRELTRRIESRGGAAKVSGAGGLRGPGAGCVVVYHPNLAALELDDLVTAGAVLPVRLGAEGVRREP